ncbi:MAG TPA: hypothetical protein PLD73_12720 [Candidatus Hydrogenedentes bacterium]|nr:hypothetical protein [Candidatus Hydrogenedentota bacterium]HPJ98892.1 hypothetical protein [Candidatus Hydrogenedentota bacterium]
MPMRRLFAAAAISAFAAPLFAGESPENVLRTAENQVVTAWKSVQAARGVLHATVQVDLQGLTLPIEASGPFAFKNHEGKRLFRVDLEGDISAPAVSPTGALPVQGVGVFDGSIAHFMTNMLFQKTVMRYRPEEQDLAIGGDALFKALHENCELRLLPERTLDKVPCHVFEAVVREPGDDMLEPVKWTLFFAKDTGLPLYVQALDRRNVKVFSCYMTGVVLNPELNLSRFNFVPPPGARVVEGDDFSQLIPIPR